MNLQIQTRTLGDVTILDCSGKLVFGDETTLLRDAVKHALKDNPRLVLNLSKVTYVDSSGLGMLVALNASTRATGGSLKISGLNGRVNDLIQLTRLASAFELYNSAEDAAATYNTTAGTSSPPEWVA
jgi:anti-sigma B factor antagonist